MPDTQRIIIYQIFTRLFGNRNLTNRPNGTIDENGCGKMNDITASALASIRQLGATHVWYTGIIEHATKTGYTKYGIVNDSADVVKGNAGSPYAIKDYYDIDPDLAADVPNRMKEFEELVQRTHKAGMKVLIDFVPNHVARQYKSDAAPAGTVDFGTNDNTALPFSPNNNFYYLPGTTFTSPDKSSSDKWSEHPARATGNNCFLATPSINDWYETVKLNYGINCNGTSAAGFDTQPDTWLKMRDIILFWKSKHVDGFRCDMAGMVPLQFWQWLTAEIRAQYPETLFIAEIYEPQLYSDYIFKGGFDYLYDKMFFYDRIREVMEGKIPASSITGVWQATEGLHPYLLYFLENHDEQRIASSFFLGNPHSAISGITLAATMFNNPVMLYFGQEIGERGMNSEGFSGCDGRTSIFDYYGLELMYRWWNSGAYNSEKFDSETRSLRNFYQQLFNTVHNSEALRHGHFYDLMWANHNNPHCNSSQLFAFLRHTPSQAILVIANFANSSTTCKLKLPADAMQLAGLNEKHFFCGTDLLGHSQPLQFSGIEALNSGIEATIAARMAAIYNIEVLRADN